MTTADLRAWQSEHADDYRMRSIEITLSGAYDTLPLVRDELTRARMQLAIREMSLALCKARADYVALLPAGRRIVWDIA